MSALFFQVITAVSDLLIICFILHYLLNIRSREKDLEKKENKIDTNYHQIVDNALSRERKILEDATDEADQIIASTEYVSQASKETVDQAMQKMVVDIQKEAVDTAQDFAKSYQASLKLLATQSLNDFQKVTRELEADLQKQIKEFHDTLRPDIEKELDVYKKSRFDQVEQLITHVVQEVSQEILNKSISQEDHQKLLIESMEKAKKNGVFD